MQSLSSVPFFSNKTLDEGAERGLLISVEDQVPFVQVYTMPFKPFWVLNNKGQSCGHNSSTPDYFLAFMYTKYNLTEGEREGDR